MLLNANSKKENSSDIHIITQHTEREDNIHGTGALSWGVQTALSLHHYLQKQLYSTSEKTNKTHLPALDHCGAKAVPLSCLGARVSNSLPCGSGSPSSSEVSYVLGLMACTALRNIFILELINLIIPEAQHRVGVLAGGVPSEH